MFILKFTIKIIIIYQSSDTALNMVGNKEFILGI